MLIGVRTQEMRFATWEEINLKKGIWEIPVERMKMCSPHIVPLSTQVIELLDYKGCAAGHGFRHTISTILHEANFDRAWVELQLPHIDKNSIRGTYNHDLLIQ